MATKKPEAPTMLASEAVTEIQRGLKLFKAFERAEEVCSLLAGIDQVIAERNKAAADALALVTDSQRKASKLADDTKAYQARHDGAKASAEAAEAEALAEAKAEVKRLKAEAKAAASDMAEQIKSATEELGALRLQIEHQKQALKDAEKMVEEFKAGARAALK